MISADQGQYNKRTLFRYLVILGVWTLLWKFSKGYVALILPPYLFMLIGQKRAVDLFFWVLVLIFPTIGNPYFYPTSSVPTLVTRLTLMCIAVLLMMRIAGRRAPAFIRPMLGILFYIAWEVIISFQGYAPIVSYLKLLLFVPLYLAIYAIACDVTRSSRANARQTRTVVLAVCILFIGGSMVLTRFPSIGQMVAMRQTMRGGDVAELVGRIAAGENVSLFCGMCAHSQALGPTIALMATLLFADYVFAVRRKDWIYLGLLLSCPILIYKTSSRTAMGTFIMGIGMVVYLFMQARAVGQRWKGKVLMTVFALVVLGLGSAIAVPKVRDRALGFVLKFSGEDRSTKDLTAENLTSSRQGLMEASLVGFREKPLLGNGFQVGWWMQYERRSGLLSYASAPIEKGVWPTAVLEEGGAIGLMLFAGFLFVTLVILVKRHAYCGASMLWTFMFSNLGEFNFFTMSYIGGFGWTLIFTGLILDGQRLKTVGLPVFFVPQAEEEEEEEG